MYVNFIEKVEAAFAKVPYPGDNNIVEDSSGIDIESNEIAAAFQGRHWRTIPFGILQKYVAAVSFFTIPAFRYYLPAYIIASINKFYETSDIPVNAIYSFIPPRHDTARCDFYQRRLNAFSVDELEVIKEFLLIMRDQHAEDFPDDTPAQALKFVSAMTINKAR